MREPWAHVLEKLYSGESAALETLYAQTSGHLYRVITDIFGTNSTAADVLKEVYTRVWQDREEWKTRGGPSEDDLCRLAHRLALKAAYAAKLKESGSGIATSKMDKQMERGV